MATRYQIISTKDLPLATITAINSHLTDTANPHSVTAAQVAAVPNDGWIATSWASLTRTGDTTFTTSTDVSAILRKGHKLRFTDTTTKYLCVLSATFGSGVTTITTIPTSDYALVGNPSAVYYSPIESPAGWPEYFNFVVTYNRTTTNYTNAPTTVTALYQCRGNMLAYNVVYLQDAAPGGAGSAQFTIPVTPVGTFVCPAVNNNSGESCLVIFNNNALGTLARYDNAVSATASNYYSSNAEVRF